MRSRVSHAILFWEIVAFDLSSEEERVLLNAPLDEFMDDAQLTHFATRYAAAWSSQNADSLAAFYAEDGSLTVNNGAPSIGRSAVRATVAGFMNAFPDMLVRMDAVVRTDSVVRFHWTWTGANTGPGGTGRSVHIDGLEEWTMTPSGLIARSVGHYDEAEYQRQMAGSGTLPSRP